MFLAGEGSGWSRGSTARKEHASLSPILALLRTTFVVDRSEAPRGRVLAPRSIGLWRHAMRTATAACVVAAAACMVHFVACEVFWLLLRCTCIKEQKTGFVPAPARCRMIVAAHAGCRNSTFVVVPVAFR